MEKNTELLLLLGEIKGELNGIHTLVQTTSDSTNKRIDDLGAAMNRRLEDHQADTAEKFHAIDKQINKKGATAGGVGGLIASGLTQLITQLLKGG